MNTGRVFWGQVREKGVWEVVLWLLEAQALLKGPALQSHLIVSTQVQNCQIVLLLKRMY